jgi:hypothetical protein
MAPLDSMERIDNLETLKEIEPSVYLLLIVTVVPSNLVMLMVNGST